MIGALAYAPFFFPTGGPAWTNENVAVVATLFYVLFAVAFTLRPVLTRLAEAATIAPFTLLSALYLACIEYLLVEKAFDLRMTLGAFSLVLGIAATRIRALTPAMRLAYRSLALLAFNLLLHSLLAAMALVDVIALEGAALCVLGTRCVTPLVSYTGIALLALTGIDLARQAVVEPPLGTALSSVTISLVVWLASMRIALRTFPLEVRDIVVGVMYSVAFGALTRAALDAAGGLFWNVDGVNARAEVTLSVVWAAYAAVIFARGVAKRTNARWAGLAIFAATVAKVLFVDLASVDIVDRVLVCIPTGLILIASAVWAMRADRTPDAAPR